MTDSPDGVAFGSDRGRWVLAVAVLGSGLAFLDGTVVNVALAEIGRDLDASTSSLQWILNGYLLTLASLILLGGSLGDRYGRRRVFMLKRERLGARREGPPRAAPRLSEQEQQQDDDGDDQRNDRDGPSVHANVPLSCVGAPGDARRRLNYPAMPDIPRTSGHDRSLPASCSGGGSAAAGSAPAGS